MADVLLVPTPAALAKTNTHQRAKCRTCGVIREHMAKVMGKQWGGREWGLGWGLDREQTMYATSWFRKNREKFENTRKTKTPINDYKYDALRSPHTP